MKKMENYHCIIAIPAILGLAAALSGCGDYGQYNYRVGVQSPSQAAASEIANFPLGIIGEVETVYLPEFKAPFEARIDTGATTSSIDAADIKAFERDGQKWVSFKVKSRTSDEVHEYELPVVRVVPIKRHGAAPMDRYCVMFKIRMGHMTIDREFTLANRSEFTYPVLIGRNLLNGLAIVDPSRKNSL